MLLAIVWNVPFMEGCGLIQSVEAFTRRAVANKYYSPRDVCDVLDVRNWLLYVVF